MIIACLAALALMAGETAPAGSEPATVAEAKMLAERTKQEIAQEERIWSEETAREKEAESRRRQRFAEFGQDRLRLQQTLAEQEEKLRSALARMEGHQLRSKELQARFARLLQVPAARARELRAALAAGLPYRLDKRLEALDLLIRDAEGGDISPEEAANRLWAFEQNERRLAQEAEVYSGDFSEEAGASDPIQVKYLRVGKQVLAFSSLDGSKLGILRRLPETDSASRAGTPGSSPSSAPGKPAYAWIREAEMDREMRQAIKQAIATAEGKSVPGFVPMPIWKSAFADPVASGALGAQGARGTMEAAPKGPAASPARKGGAQ